MTVVSEQLIAKHNHVAPFSDTSGGKTMLSREQLNQLRLPDDVRTLGGRGRVGGLAGWLVG
ncbi:hypothetical protein E2C01_071452 [Portunus trituberculatus]|uniref:Uncharacterized protein n=1 Tax=Portunus trituberculatus TaxID=210409 RepID=A0A5B7I892_PORTR|nr:hypothetical protein [Portunus trituberculatus]